MISESRMRELAEKAGYTLNEGTSSDFLDKFTKAVAACMSPDEAERKKGLTMMKTAQKDVGKYWSEPARKESIEDYTANFDKSIASVSHRAIRKEMEAWEVYE